MQGRHEYQPQLFSAIDVESLIPKSHLLRRIDRVLDLSFLAELTAPLYSKSQGRPSIDPEVFVRMVLLGYLYNIDSDRQLCEEVGYNLAYRWFCRLSLKDSVPDHSSMTKIRDRLGEKTYEEIFDHVVDQCGKAGLVKLEQVMVDGSAIRANASIYGMKEREASDEDRKDDDEPRGQIHSKDGLSNNDFRKRGILGKKISNKTHFSPVDPDATLAGKTHETKSLSYKTHHAIDAGSRVIIDCHVTTGSVSDITVFPDRIAAIEEKYEMNIGEVIADRGYGSGDNLSLLEKRGIKSNIPLWSPRSGMTYFRQLEEGFKISDDGKTVHCPEGHKMRYGFFDTTNGRHTFNVPRAICSLCPRQEVCLTEHERKQRGKRFFLIEHFKTIERVESQSKEPIFKQKLWQRMWKMEGIFAEAKSHHGMRRARYRGRAKMQIQVYMTATVQNLKRLAGSLSDDLAATLQKFVREFLGSKLAQEFA